MGLYPACPGNPIYLIGSPLFDHVTINLEYDKKFVVKAINASPGNCYIQKVILNGERVKLTPTEFSLLALLVQNAGRVLTHKQLLEKVWGWEYIDDVDHVRVYIWHLRQKIEPDPAQPRYIVTEPGVGYYFWKSS